MYKRLQPQHCVICWQTDVHLNWVLRCFISTVKFQFAIDTLPSGCEKNTRVRQTKRIVQSSTFCLSDCLLFYIKYANSTDGHTQSEAGFLHQKIRSVSIYF